MSKSPKRGPVLIDLEAADTKKRQKAKQTPATAPPVPDLDTPAPTGQAMQTVAALSARRPSRLGRWFWGLLLAITGFFASLAAWNAITALLAQNPLLGLVASTLIGLFAAVLLIIALRELAAFSRLRRLDRIQDDAAKALAHSDLKAARAVTRQLTNLYKSRDDTKWGREKLAERQGDVLDAATLLGAAEADLLAPLDAAASLEVQAAARQVATVTAIVPLAFADVIAALTSNIRMIRRIAEIYGGRAGTIGSWRLTRTVMLHLVATGAVAVGDDLIGTIAGGGVLSKVSRRFGEGIVNGALTARVGVAAMEVCRPLPFTTTKRPSVTSLVKNALTGLFGSQS
ncbi:YcjF family protein [Nereida sp. MMG025]|uniref:YcjF family protein n=1 Tax=Nereida sp. MMG025 TaxID=2909981 RepID=UPI001F42E8AB|nr:TIGR01620 family protein [Nereida sp. MMG025]MCF6444954.1 YcjF family protein [Nereida sp. MMG025]